MVILANYMDVTDRSAWWRLPQGTSLVAPGLRLNGVGLDGRSTHAPYHPHWQLPRYGWVYLLAGAGFFESSACGHIDLEAGDIAICQPGHWHNYGPKPGDTWIEAFCFVDGPLVDSLLQHGDLPQGPILHGGLDAPLRTSFLALVEAARAGQALIAAATWYTLVGHLSACPARLSAPARRERHAADLHTIANQLCADPGRNWSFPHLAETVGLGYEAFRKAFTRRYRMPPQAFLQRERMHRACRLLWEGKRVNEVAAALGFADPFHFSRVFKRCLGQSPRAFLAGIHAVNRNTSVQERRLNPG